MSLIVLTGFEIRFHSAIGKIEVAMGYYPSPNKPSGVLDLILRIPNAKKQIPQMGICFFGDSLEIRTPDPLLKRQLLCQLS